ncbi:MAG TPA: NADPH-dependent 7-cyano-7-deazaguanine reductase QueF [Firmicutes bacterium]|jgi:7-cyano-7-deazaguanine reductase|nr:NADPH-dependent 7-cyano-7-deazaguanine reductase QueF [Bacillota bacterium]
MVKKSAAELHAAWTEYNAWLKNRPPQGWEGMRFDVDGPEAIRPDIIETFPYWYSGSNAVITIQTDEFLSVCPWSGLPDFAQLTIEYIPNEKCIELKSLKYYLYTWRNVGMYYEHIINKLLQDLVEVADPVWMRIKGEFNVRGGLGTQAEIEYGVRDVEARDL